MNSRSIEMQRMSRKRKKKWGKKVRRKQEKVSGIEIKEPDSEEWKQLKISAMRSVITERRKKNSFFLSFFHSKIKTLINLNQQGSRTSPFLFQTPGGEGVFFLPPVHSSR